jgi:hypothetical protein
MSFGKSALVFGDAHVQAGEPEVHLRRFNALGHLALKYRPQTILCGGDLWDLPSLAAHLGSKAVGGGGSTLHHQNKKLGQDLHAGKDAILRIERPIEEYNRAQGRAGRSGQKYKPAKVFLLGNHENRLKKVGNHSPELADVVNVKSMLVDWLQARGWDVYDGEAETYWLEGVGFRHYFGDKKGNPIPITTAKSNLPRSSVWFHQHSFATAERRYDCTIDRFLAMPCYKPEHRLGDKESSGVVFLNDIPYNRALMHAIESKGPAMAA